VTSPAFLPAAAFSGRGFSHRLAVALHDEIRQTVVLHHVKKYCHTLAYSLMGSSIVHHSLILK
jgi:hypothetical protein